MALGEARTAWQRTANRYLVQEDAKRAPKLACCSPTAPPVKPDDVRPTNTTDKEDIHNITRSPLDHNSTDFNLSPESQWWLHLQPNYIRQKGLMNEQLNFQETNMETLATHEGSNVHSNRQNCRGDEKELSSLYSMKSRYDLDFDELTITDFCDSKLSEKSSDLYLDSTSSWIRAEKHVPWWRTADTEELSILVSQRSLDVIENCDLPQPQSTCVRKDAYSNVCDFGRGGIYKSPLDQKPKTRSVTIPTPYRLRAENACQKQWAPVEVRPQSNTSRSTSPTAKGPPERHTSDVDLSKAQLLEALRHSQTRAREAEKAAKCADAEKEDLVKLIFRQASQLFAYKQWFHLLQLENIYIQMKNNYSEPVSTVLPRMGQRTRNMRKSGWQKCTRGKRATKPRYRYNGGKCAIFFALGLGLVGAGLLLGWTVGLMLPTL